MLDGSLTRAAIAGVVMGLMVALIGAPGATGIACDDNRRSVIGSPGTNGRGTKSGDRGIRVANDSIDCTKWVSVGNRNSSSTRFVMVGWYEKDHGSWLPDCQINAAGNPRVLVLKIVEGTWTCDNDTAGITNTPVFNEFWVHDKDQDGDWRYYRNGNYLGFYGLGTFVTGTPFARGSRVDPDDGSAELEGLQRMNADENWTDWTGSYVDSDTDPQFVGCFYSFGTEFSIQPVAC